MAKSEWGEWLQCVTPPEILAAQNVTERSVSIVKNERYEVNIYQLPSGITWLSCKRRNKSDVHDWRELWRIKNELCGEDREAFEVYPSVRRVVDTSNQYHLFVLPEGLYFNVGYAAADVNDEAPDTYVPGQARQRPLPAWMPRVEVGNDERTVPVVMGQDEEGGAALLFDGRTGSYAGRWEE